MSDQTLPTPAGAAEPTGPDAFAPTASAAPGSAATPGSAPTDAAGGRRSPLRMLPVAAAIVYALIAGGLAPISLPAELAMLLGGAAVAGWALGLIPGVPAPRRRPAPDWIDGRGSLAWLAVLLVFAVWELYAFFRGSTPAHPTLSVLMGPLLAPHLNRSVAYLAWLSAGVWIARR